MGKSEGEDYKQSVRYAKAQEEQKEKFFSKTTDCHSSALARHKLLQGRHEKII